MRNDYAKQKKQPSAKGSSRSRSPQKKSTANKQVPWLSVVCFLIVGLFIAGLIMLRLEHHRPPVYAANAPTNETAAVATSASTATLNTLAPVEQAEPTFDFYDKLPKGLPKTAATPSPAAHTVAKTSISSTKIASNPLSTTLANAYVIQLAAFSQNKDADAFKQRLILVGYTPHIEKTMLHDKAWYRVVLGPYGKLYDAQSDSNRLKKLGFSNLVSHRSQKSASA